MTTTPLAVEKAEALAALKEYRAHRASWDKLDVEMARIYRAVAKGKTVISANDAIRSGGLDNEGRPKLAILQADAERCVCSFRTDYIEFSISIRGIWNTKRPMRIEWPGIKDHERIQAVVPRIPPQHRPAASELGKYHILWEADWHAIPRDPYLLKRIGKDAFVVLACWDLSEIEMNVLRAHAPRRV